MNQRRRFLGRAAAGAVGGGLFARGALAQGGNVPPNVPAWMLEQGQDVNAQPYGLPDESQKGVVKLRRPSNTGGEGLSLTPLQSLHGIITPTGLAFERHHAGVPKIAPDQHRLVLHGLVKRPLVFTMDDLVRFPSQSHIYFLECSGNGSREWRAPVAKTIQESHGLLSCCEWTGVPLATLLDEAGVLPEAKWILAEGADAAAMTRSLPLAKALEDALIVYAQNGEMLRPQQGFPVRLFVPGWEGNISVKWLRRLKVGDSPFFTHEETARYTDLMADGSAREFTLFMEAKSVITSPSSGQELKGPGFREITGLAWTGAGRIKRVEVSVDGGRSWQQARLQEPVLSRALTRFHLPWRWDGSPAILQSRAIDETGYVQPKLSDLVKLRGVNSRYHNNSIQSFAVSPAGKVTNVHA